VLTPEKINDLGWSDLEEEWDHGWIHGYRDRRIIRRCALITCGAIGIVLACLSELLVSVRIKPPDFSGRSELALPQLKPSHFRCEVCSKISQKK
jgi:hypothetical protein